MTTSLGTTSGFFGAFFIALAPFTAGATIIPAFILSGVITFVISVVARISANLNSMIQGIQTISRSMIDENTSNAIAGLQLNLERQINELKNRWQNRTTLDFCWCTCCDCRNKKVIVEMEKLKNS